MSNIENTVFALVEERGHDLEEDNKASELCEMYAKKLKSMQALKTLSQKEPMEEFWLCKHAFGSWFLVRDEQTAKDWADEDIGYSSISPIKGSNWRPEGYVSDAELLNWLDQEAKTRCIEVAPSYGNVFANDPVREEPPKFIKFHLNGLGYLYNADGGLTHPNIREALKKAMKDGHTTKEEPTTGAEE